jgi:hypothetical protein
MGIIHRLLAAALIVHSATCTSNSIRSFENSNVQRTIELGGSLTHVTTTFTVKALGTLGPNVYTLALSELDQKRTALFDVKLKGSKEELKLEKFGFNPKRCAFIWYTLGFMLTVLPLIAMRTCIRWNYQKWRRMRLPRLSSILFCRMLRPLSQLLLSREILNSSSSP